MQYMFPTKGVMAASPPNSFVTQDEPPASSELDDIMMAGVASSVTIAGHLALSHYLRVWLTEGISHHLTRECLMEFVAAVELCCVSFELGVVLENYGVSVWSMCIFLLILWRSRSWGITTACPYSLLEKYVESGANPLHIAFKIAAQLLGAIVSSRWIKQLWMMELVQAHVGRGMNALDNCTADLHVPVILGFLIECVLTCACCLFSRALGQLEPKFAPAINSFFTTTMVILAFDYSGGYFNPVLATGLKWSCRGHTNMEHILVYWAGSILGSMLSLKLWSMPLIKSNFVNRVKAKAQ